MDPLGEAEANYLRAKLQPFLSRNPESDLRAGGREPSVIRLWGEEAIEIPLRGIDSKSIDLIATDPPFNKGVKAFGGITTAGANVSYSDVWKEERWR